MTLACKPGVTPHSLWIAAALTRVSAPVGIVITAGSNGQHMPRSKHYTHDALDVRTKNFPNVASKRAFADAVQLELGHDYQVIFEGEGTDSEHVHIEYDPR